ncbi:MAG: hypothetical protein AAF587_21105 [Bacteroidota bacterium]
MIHFSDVRGGDTVRMCEEVAVGGLCELMKVIQGKAELEQKEESPAFFLTASNVHNLSEYSFD